MFGLDFGATCMCSLYTYMRVQYISLLLNVSIVFHVIECD